MIPQPSQAEASIVLIDDPTLFAESLRTVLQLEGYDVHQVAAEPAAVMRECLETSAESSVMRIAVLDLDVGSTRDPLRMIGQLSAVGVRVLVVTASADRSQAAESLECGAVGVLPKTLPLAEMVDAIGRLRDGLPLMSAAERGCLVEEWHRSVSVHDDLDVRFARLNHAEQRILTHLMEGRMIHAITADGLMPHRAARHHLRAVVKKLQVATWLDAVTLANEYGWQNVNRLE